MVNASEDIRKLMDRLSTIVESDRERLDERPFSGIRGALDRRVGRKERQEMLDKLEREWHIWLGKSDRDGTMDDMELFLQRVVEFTPEDVDAVFGNEEEKPKDEPAVDEPDDEPEDEPETEVEPEAEPAPAEPEDDGRTFNPDDKMSDYGKVGDEANEFHGEPATYQKADGSWNEDLIQKKLDQLEAQYGRGMVLVLGDSHFSMEEKAGQEAVVQTESIINEFALGKLSKTELKDIFGRVVNHYLDKAPTRKPSSNRSPSQGSTSTGKSPANIDAMWEILKAYGLSSQVVKRVMNKVASSNGVADMSDNDMKHLSLIGYAFAKSSR